MRHYSVIKTLGMLAIAVLFAAVACAISTSPMYAAGAENTEFAGGDGTQAAPYEIASADDFVKVMKGVNDRTAVNGYFGKSFRLIADINLAGINISPIGDFLYPFKGRFDGGGYTVSGLNIGDSDGAYIGLFGVISADAVIENLTVSGKVTGLTGVGGIVGLNNGRISGCVGNVAVSSKSDSDAMDIGGICGHNIGRIENSYNNGSVIGHGWNTGGIAGLNMADASEAVIANCFNAGKIESDLHGAGGIAGHNVGAIECSFNSAAIKAYSTAGGIAGSNAGRVENAYNSGNICVTNDMAGGITGSSEGAIYNSYSRAGVTAASLKGGISGLVSADAVIEACFFSSNAFSGKITARGNDYPNSAVLRDKDMVNADALTNAEKMKALGEGRGAGMWSKRAYSDEFCYFPELKNFRENADVTIKNFSESRVKIKRAAADVRLGTLTYVYNGAAREPDIYLGEEKLVKGLDYTVSYSNNVNAGAAKASITMINYYKGVVEKTFDITKSPITVTWKTQEYTYNGAVQYPEAEVSDGLVGGEVIEFAYTGAGKAAGKYKVTAELAETAVNANYSFQAESCDYEIKQAGLAITWSEDKLIYNGAAQYPRASISSGSIAGDAITIRYSGFENNINAGDGYSVKASLEEGGDNGNYSLNETRTYSILKKPIGAAFDNAQIIYNGKAQYPLVASVTGVLPGDELNFAYLGYEGNIRAGEGYKVYAELANTAVNANYELAKAECTYSIAKRALSVNISESVLIYNGKPQRPSFTVNGLIDGESVEWAYSDFSGNIGASTGGAYTLAISLGSGADYAFEPLTIRYDIAPMPITVAWDGTDLIYNGKVQRSNAVVTEETPDVVELIYADFNGIGAGSGYRITVAAESANYVVKNVLTYDILPREISAVWSTDTFVYNGIAQYPSAEFIGVVAGDDIGADIKSESIRPGNYRITAEINNPNYDLIDTGFAYTILPKPIALIGATGESKVYDGNAYVRVSGGELYGVEADDEVGFVISRGEAENANAGAWRVKAQVTLTGAYAECYTLIAPEIFVNIDKAVFSTDILRFNSETFAYDGEEKSLKIEGKLPEGIVVEYIGNGKKEIGEYTVTAKFSDNSGNYEPIPDMTAKILISRSEFVDDGNKVRVEVDNGALPFGAEMKIVKQNEWEGEYDKKQSLGAIEISLLLGGAEIQPNGILKITLALDEKTLGAKGLILLHVGKDKKEVTAYTIEGNNMVFYTESLSEFVLLADTQDDTLWLILSGAAIATIILGTTAGIFVKRRKFKAAKNQITLQKSGDNVLKPSIIENHTEKSLEISKEIPFTLDGVKCAGKTSLIAALCFKNAAKQKEVAGMNAEKAQVHANGKGGCKRRELYWQGKRVIKGSKEYADLLRRADELTSEEFGNNSGVGA